MFGNFVQASGQHFLTTLTYTKPQIFHQILNAYADVLKKSALTALQAFPMARCPLPLVSASQSPDDLSPGSKLTVRRLIEGNCPGETVVVVDDILISGKSAMEGAQKLESAGLNVHDIVVFMDHGQGVKDRLQENGYRAHAVLTISEITETLYQAGY